MAWWEPRTCKRYRHRWSFLQKNLYENPFYRDAGSAAFTHPRNRRSKWPIPSRRQGVPGSRQTRPGSGSHPWSGFHLRRRASSEQQLRHWLSGSKLPDGCVHRTTQSSWNYSESGRRHFYILSTILDFSPMSMDYGIWVLYVCQH